MDGFDPYRKWLGIPPQEQPPNHYRLLGIGLFESDFDVISNASDRADVPRPHLPVGALRRDRPVYPQRTVGGPGVPARSAAEGGIRPLAPADDGDGGGGADDGHATGHGPQPAPAAPPAGPAAAAPEWSWSAGTPPAPAPSPPSPPPAPAPWANPACAAGRAGPRPIVVPPAPGRAKPAEDDFLASVSAPTAHHGHAGYHKKKSSAQAMGIGIALAAFSVVFVAIILACLLSQSGNSSNDDDAMFGPGRFVERHVPGPRISSETKSDRVVERTVEHPVRTGRAVAGAGPARRGILRRYPGHSQCGSLAPVVPARNPQPRRRPTPLRPTPRRPPAASPTRPSRQGSIRT